MFDPPKDVKESFNNLVQYFNFEKAADVKLSRLTILERKIGENKERLNKAIKENDFKRIKELESRIKLDELELKFCLDWINIAKSLK